MADELIVLLVKLTSAQVTHRFFSSTLEQQTVVYTTDFHVFVLVAETSLADALKQHVRFPLPSNVTRSITTMLICLCLQARIHRSGDLATFGVLADLHVVILHSLILKISAS
jgi:hypothetical protein